MFDCLFVQPTPSALCEALLAAQAQANARGVFASWTREVATLHAGFIQQSREGVQVWADELFPVLGYEWGGVALAWWTDHLQRRHVRVQGFAQRDVAYAAGLFAPEPCPLYAVYPHVSMTKTIGSKQSRLVWCRCGEVAPLGAAGWMGPCCAGCHDRLQEGEPLPDLAEQLQLRIPALPSAVQLPAGSVYVLSDDGSTLASLQDGRRLCIWEGETGRLQMDAHIRPAEALRFRADSQQLAILSQNEVRLWNRHKQSWRPGATFSDAWDIAWSPDGQRLALAGRQHMRIWEAGTAMTCPGLPQTRRLTPGPCGRADALAWASQGQNLFWLAESELSYQPDSYRLQRFGPTYWGTAYDPVIPGEAFLSPDGRWLGVIGQEVTLYAAGINTMLGTIGWPDHNPGPRTARFTRDGRGLLQQTARSQRVIPWLDLWGVRG